MIDYGFKKELELSFEETLERVTAELKKKGFGVLTEIDVQEKFRQKLNKEFKRYRILGACNPANAYRAIEAEEDIGLLLPCNVIVYEKKHQTVVAIIRPTRAMVMVDNTELMKVAREVESDLKKVFDNLDQEE
jgi:uncharacterized protein (DUF302 family)